jgi:hypothetical protein
MDGLSIKVKTTDGVEASYKLTPRVIVAFEQQYGKGMPKLLGEEQKIEHIFWLAWKCMGAAGVVVKPWGPEFLDTIITAELDADESFGSTEIA